MSPKLPRITTRQLLRALSRDGWEQVRQRGSHVQLKHATKPGLVTVPQHVGAIVKPHILESVLEQAGLSAADLTRLL